MPVNHDKREYRSMPLMLLRNEGDKLIDSEYYIEGYATTFDDPYVLMTDGETEYKEVISADAFRDADMSDVILQYNHAGAVLARLSNNTLLLNCDDHGLFVAADLSKSQNARDMYEEIQNGLVTKMSWAFTVAEDSYNRETFTRTVTKVAKVYDVSVVSMPANPETEISARNYVNGVIDMVTAERQARAAQIKKIKLMTEV